jgi:hypothetical protein
MEQFARFTLEERSRLDQHLQERQVRPCGENVR